MVSSELAAPKTFMPGFDLEEVGHLKYGRRLHFWNFEKREPIETMYLGEDGLIPLEVKFHHDPDSTHGFFARVRFSREVSPPKLAFPPYASPSCVFVTVY